MSASPNAEPSLDREVAMLALVGLWRLLRWLLLIVGLFAGVLVYLLAQMLVVGGQHSSRAADVGIVLGGGVTNGEPSAPYDARIRYAVEVYKAGKVKRLLFCGGSIMGQREEGLVGRDQAIAMGVPASAILVDPVSWTTQLNFVEAKKLMAANAARTGLVITEPLHMMRSLRMARDLGMQVEGEPPPASFYRTLHERYIFMRSELFLYLIYIRYGI